MKIVTRMQLKPGMELGEDVENQGSILFKAGTIIDEMMINRLNRYGILCVTIKEPVDYAKTESERIQFNEEFQKFVKIYQDCLIRYKGIMISYIGFPHSIDSADLIALFDECQNAISRDNQILDFLYYMLPGEDEMTYSQCLSSALLAGTFGKWLNLPPDELKLLILSGFYYDIGKLNIPVEILWKPGKLTDEEFALVKRHPVVGYSIVRNDTNLNEHIKNAVIMHHERMDGSGYPYHMKGDKIDKYARYMAIVDTYIAMASPRTFRNAFTPFQILANFETSMDKYDVSILMPIMEKIASALIGSRVQLSDNSIWEVALKSPSSYSRPILRNNENEFLDLTKKPNLEIVKMA